jgi:GNAT superfamily N-acetyltransferase
VVGSRSDQPFVLRGVGTACRIRPWANEPNVAQLVLYNQRRLPSVADVQQWLGELTRLGFTAVRTGALNVSQARLVDPLGFVCLQELVLLEHSALRNLPTPAGPAAAVAIRRLDRDEHAAAAVVDRLAFGLPWGLDEPGIAEVCLATARHRARAVHLSGVLVGHAISGRDTKIGFLQRLAVHPDAQRHGIGLALVLDSLRWSARWRMSRVLVNTHIGNTAALTLYERVGFRRLPELLRVFEKTLT